MAQSQISTYYRTRKRPPETDGAQGKRQKQGDLASTAVCSPFVETPEEATQPFPAAPVQTVKKAPGKTRNSAAKTTPSTRGKRKSIRNKGEASIGPSIESLLAASIAVEPPPSTAVEPPPTPPTVSFSEGAPGVSKETPPVQQPPVACDPPQTSSIAAPSPRAVSVAGSKPQSGSYQLQSIVDLLSSPSSSPIKSRAARMLEMARSKASPTKTRPAAVTPVRKPPPPPPPPPPSAAVAAATSAAARSSVSRRLLTDAAVRPTAKDLKNLSGKSARELAEPCLFAPPPSKGPTLSGRKGFKVESPVKSPRKPLPAHQRFQDLTRAPDADLFLDLPIPQKYLLLGEKFRCMDVIVNMLQQRGETCTFLKLKGAVEEMLRRSFEQKCVGQVKEVYPSAFLYRQESQVPGHYDRALFQSHQLIVAANVAETASAEPCVTSGSGFKYLNTTSLLKRRQIFRRRLVQRTLNHHQEFLKGRGLEVAEEEVRRWHPEFPLEALPDVPAAALPQPPTSNGIASAKLMLNQLMGRASAGGGGRSGKPNEAALVGDVGAGEPPPSADGVVPVGAGLVGSGVLKGVSADLVERVRQREAERVRRQMVRDSPTQRTLDILSRLPSLCRVIKSHFVSVKKTAIPLDDVVQKLLDSHSSAIGRGFLVEHLNVLLTAAPQWLRKVTVGKIDYLKLLNKNLGMTALDRLLEVKTKELSAPV